MDLETGTRNYMFEKTLHCHEEGCFIGHEDIGWLFRFVVIGWHFLDPVRSVEVRGKRDQRCVESTAILFPQVLSKTGEGRLEEDGEVVQS